jgi:hypothetical protein
MGYGPLGSLIQYFFSRNPVSENEVETQLIWYSAFPIKVDFVETAQMI